MVWVIGTTEKKIWKKAALVIPLLIYAVGLGFAGDLRAADFDDKILHGRGPIDRIENDLIVITDVLRPIAPVVTYQSAITGLAASPSEFRPGVFVGFRLNSKREIIALWLLEDER